MSREREDLDATFPEALVELILAIQRFAEGTRSRGGSATRSGPNLGVDAAGSISDLAPVPDPVGPHDPVGDGGDYRFTARETDEGLLVVGDLRGFEGKRRETEVDLGEDALILTIGERVVSRVPIDDGWTTITDVSVNNDVLEVRVRICE